METYQQIDENTILISKSNPVVDSDGNALNDADGNPIVNTQNTIITADEANANLQQDQMILDNLSKNLSDIQSNIDNLKTKIELDNMRIQAFSETQSKVFISKLSNNLEKNV